VAQQIHEVQSGNTDQRRNNVSQHSDNADQHNGDTSRPQPPIVLSVRDLGKRIKRREIIKGISFEVYAGEVFGFLGPNGAGKTTTIRMLVDLIKPTRGTVEVGGIDVHKHHNDALAQVGCIVENPELYGYLSGWENLEHFARMLPGVTKERIQEVTEIVGMDKRIHDKVKTYSLGMRQRLGIAQALLGRPRLLILDEPTNGLDPQGIKEMRLFIRELAATGLSVFVSSHMLSEIQLMCDRVAIISHGEVIAVGRVDELLKQYGTRVAWRLSPSAKGFAMLRDTSGVAVLGQEGRADEAGNDSLDDEILTQLDAELIPNVNAALVAAGVKVRSIEMKNPSLEDLFLSLTEGERID
jgi:ABC-2 type transport system ATP-binding protein